MFNSILFYLNFDLFYFPLGRLKYLEFCHFCNFAIFYNHIILILRHLHTVQLCSCNLRDYALSCLFLMSYIN